ncbi:MULTISPECIES: deoxynucleoside kinase [Alteribacter]|uniref:Deoxynucleoside kinase n=1 Tax=Alteribacter keqinensis TaxID=2483800 RepID=A0A3M7TUT7_9BACI|nr:MULTISPECIES: deoxynucleoside kinase [Alteribacter]MBM7094576.1 deoxynucleoside kinase [Alteribacter salitolerans]RNA69213.1 deoxynucleoside kinase [Alteribacter keqinensis]
MNHVPFIAVEGPIGVGKTSLAEKLSEDYRYFLLKEIVEENPFLGKFYEDINEWSFQTEMFFLCNRFKQLEDIQQIQLNQNQPVVSDYHIFKNRIFAKQTLKDDHFRKYDQIYHLLAADLPKPNVIIYLKASLDTLLKRIARRGRSIEKQIDPSYLEQLSRDYEMFIQTFKETHPDIPVITILGDEMDFVHRPEDYRAIVQKVDDAMKTAATLK